MATKRIIIFLGIILVLVIGLSAVLPKLKLSLLSSKLSPTPTSLPKEEPTGTFVDKLLGDFLYFNQGGLFYDSLPSRRSTQLAGLAEGVVAIFPPVIPAWSSDGELLAVVADEKTIVVVKYDSGELVKRLLIDPKLDLKGSIELSFSPDNLHLLVAQKKDDQTFLRFFEVNSGKLVVENSNCSGLGTWMPKQYAYITTCKVADKKMIVAIDPSLETKAATPIVSGEMYQLINTFDSQTLLVSKKGQPGKLTLTGKFTPLDKKSFAPLGTLNAFADLPRALADKIETLKKTEKIDDLVISPSNSFALFHTAKGLWLIDLPIKSDPYFLFQGELPSLRPL